MQPQKRKALGKNEGDRSLYTGEFIRTGIKHGFKGDIKTVLLKDVKDESGHPCLALDEAVINAWEPVLLAKKLRTLALVPAGISQLNGKEYYKFNQDIPAGMFNKVKQFYEDFGTEGNMQGLLTCYPDQVKTILKI